MHRRCTRTIHSRANERSEFTSKGREDDTPKTIKTVTAASKKYEIGHFEVYIAKLEGSRESSIGMRMDRCGCSHGKGMRRKTRAGVPAEYWSYGRELELGMVSTCTYTTFEDVY